MRARGPDTATPPPSRRLLRLLMYVAAALLLAFLAIRLWAGAVDPPVLGVTDGELAPCPPSDNCVVSTATEPRHATDPLTCTDAEVAALAAELEVALPRTEVVTADAGYAHLEARSRVFGFVDDLELLGDGEVVQLRSAARLGRDDLGVNAARVEEVRAIAASASACG
ncbi:MAG: DUF1499 domain-containing protein [Nitriliruptoraceae bacterium]|nr:DUF1499 domain-containing protein [Nitriliruptoraceae bacterium]